MGGKRKRHEKDASTGAPGPKKQQKDAKKSSTKTKPSPPPLDTSPFLDNPQGAERKRQTELYDILGSEDTSERINAANAIVLGLLGGDGVQEATLQRHLEKLFRGLASGRKGSRLGFSIALTEILEQLFGTADLARKKYPGLTFDKALSFLITKTKPEGDLSGQEIKDHYLGQLFGLQVFVGAKVLFTDIARWATVLEKLFELAKEKPWIREECGWVIVEALAQMDQRQAEQTLEDLYKSGLALSPEGVGIWLTAKNLFPDMKFPTKPWGQSGNPMEHLKSLAKALKESSASDDSEKSQQAKQTGNWNPQLHFVWKMVLAEYVLAAKSKKHGIKSEFENFWKVAVDENLFSATASRERKFWGFQLFQKVLQESTSYGKLISSIFSHNLVRCLINHVQDKDRFLNRTADKSLKVLIQSVEVDRKLLVTVLPRLIGGYGTYNFDRITKTKTIERLVSLVDDSNASPIIKILVEPALVIKGTTESDTEKEAELRRQLLGDNFLNIIRKVNVVEGSTNTTWIQEVALPTLAKLAYSQEFKCQPPLSQKSRTLFRNRLASSFGHLLSDIGGYSFPCNLLQSVSPDAVEMDSRISDAKDNALSTTKKILKKIKKADPEDQAPLQALALLYSLVIFQLYNGESEALSVLEELKICYDKLIRHKDAEDSDTDASEILVELLLSFISKPSALLRKVSQHVFSAFMTEINANGLKLMTDVLQSDESLRGQQELFDQEPEDEDQIEDDSELDSDVEVVDMDADEGHINGHLNGDDDDSEPEDEDSEIEDDEEAKKLDDALAKALGTRRLDQEDEEDSDSDADMTDSEMMALDSKLVEIFSQRKKVPNKKQEQKDAKENMINFKNRVLDLLEIYVKKQAANPLALELLLPLLELMRTTKTKQLSEKSQNVIAAFAKAAKGTKKAESAVDIGTLEELMKTIHIEAAKDPSHSLARAASTASLMIASRILRQSKDNVEKISAIYGKSYGAWVKGEIKMQPSFFHEWINWGQSQAQGGL